jgi:hypothetical protein
MGYFYETPAEREIDAAYRTERAHERRLNAINDQPRDRWECLNIQHTLGGDCPYCTMTDDEYTAYLHRFDRPAARPAQTTLGIWVEGDCPF